MEQNYSGKALKDLRVALVHYWLVTWRGGEKVIKAILDLFPNVDIYTIFLDEELKKTYLSNYTVYPSVLNKVPLFRRHHQKIFPLYPIGISIILPKNWTPIFGG